MTNALFDDGAQQAWQAFLSVQEEYIAAQMRLFRAQAAVQGLPAARLQELLDRALHSVGERRAALLLLVDLDETVRRRNFAALMDWVAVEHRDIDLAREVILSMDRDWLAKHLPTQLERILNPSATYEAYRRLAELLTLLNSPLLQMVIERAERSDDNDIHEVAVDYRQKQNGLG
jgi:hypothetical protein